MSGVADELRSAVRHKTPVPLQCAAEAAMALDAMVEALKDARTALTVMSRASGFGLPVDTIDKIDVARRLARIE